MFGKAKSAQDVLKLINELSEEEQDKLFSALVADEEAEEKIEDAQAEEPVEETTEETAEETSEEEATEETTEEPVEETAEEAPVETETETEETEETEEVQTEEEAEQEEAKEDVNEALVARIDSLESQLAEMVERVNAIVENSEKGSFASPEAPHGFDEGNTMSEAENNYFRKANRR